jgi:hypothetical protein
MKRTQRQEAIADLIARQVRDLVLDTFEEIEGAAARMAADDTNDDDPKPVQANASIAVKWPAGDEHPLVRTKLTYTCRRVAETEDRCDVGQYHFEFATAPVVKGGAA